MAYSYDRILREKPLQDKDELALSPLRPSTANPGAPGVGGIAPVTSSPNPTPQGRAGTGFVNYDRLLSANSEKTTNLANQIASNVEGKAQTAQNNVSSLQTGFKDNNATAYGDQYKLNPGYGGDPFNGNSPGQYVDSKTFGVEAQGGDEKAYKDLHGDQNAWNKTQKSVTDAEKAAKQASTFEGLQAGLQKDYGKQGGYSPTQSRFDAALVGTVGGDRFNTLNKRYGSLTQSLNDANTAASKTAANDSDAYNIWKSSFPEMNNEPYDYEADSARRSQEAGAQATNEQFDNLLNDRGVYRPGTAPTTKDDLKARTGIDLVNPSGVEINPDGTPLNDGQKAKSQYDLLLSLGYSPDSPTMKALKSRMGWG